MAWAVVLDEVVLAFLSLLGGDLTRLILDTARETKLYKPKDHFKLARVLEGKKFQSVLKGQIDLFNLAAEDDK